MVFICLSKGAPGDRYSESAVAFQNAIELGYEASGLCHWITDFLSCHGGVV